MHYKCKEVIILGLNDVDPTINRDELEQCEVWTLNDYYRPYPWLKPDRVYQVHTDIDNAVTEMQKKRPDRWKNWREKYNESGAEIVTLKHDPLLNNQIVMDVVKMSENYGTGFFSQTFAYMAYDAIEEGYTIVKLRGFSSMEGKDYKDCFPQCIGVVDKMKEANIFVDSKIYGSWKLRAEDMNLTFAEPAIKMYGWCD